MKSIVIFYSLEGNTRLIAEKLAQTINSDILELKTKTEIKREGFTKYIWGGKQVLFREKPELVTFHKDLNQYDLIIFGSPIWASKYVPAFNTFFEDNKFLNKKYALFNCNGGGKTEKIFQQFKDQLKGNKFVGEISFKEPLRDKTEDNLKQAEEWIKKIIQNI